MIDSINWVLGPISHKMIVKNLFKPSGYGEETYHYKKDVNLKFYYASSCLAVNTTVEAVTGNTHINFTEKDKNNYLDKLKEIVCTALVDKDIYEEIPKRLLRIDFKLDVSIPDDIERKTYLKFLTELDDNCLWLKKREDYSTSKYLTGKYPMRKINLYSRYAKYHRKEERNIIRLEIQNFKRKLISNEKKFGIRRDFVNYFCFDMWQELLIDVLKKYMFFNSDHYKLKSAYTIIDGSDYSDTIKRRLKKFLNDSSRYSNITVLKKHYDRVTFSKYIRYLQQLRYPSTDFR